MAALSSRLAAAIVGRYPTAWRERYATELLALLDDRGGGWRDVPDLARGCVSEWRASLADPDQHPTAYGTSLMLRPFLHALIFAVALEGVARIAIPILNSAVGTPDVRLRVGFGLCVILPFLGRMLFTGLETLAAPGPLTFRLFRWRETWLWMSLLSVARLGLAWNGRPLEDVSAGILLAYAGVFLFGNTGSGGRRRQAYQRYRWARTELKSALRLVSREQSRSPVFANGRALRRAQHEVDLLNGVVAVARREMRGIE